MYKRNHLVLKATWWILCVLAMTAGSSAQEIAANVLLPSSRIYGYTTSQQGAVMVSAVNALIKINDTVASTTLQLELENTTAVRQEAEVILPVPDGAVVSGLAYEGSGGQQVTAQVLPKDEARRIYNALVAKIKDPALAEFIGYNLIRTSIFPLEGRARLKMQITYEHLLKVDANRIEYSIPRTESLQYEVPWQIKADIMASQPICAVYSPSHLVYTNRVDSSNVSVIIQPQAAYTPGPFQLEVLLETDLVSATMMAYPDGQDGGYFLLLFGITAQVPEHPTEMIKREVTLVLDRSGSMAGQKIIQAKDAAKQVISGLFAGEAFNVLIYNHDVQQFAQAPVLKDTATELAAHRYIDAVIATGSTNLYEALRLALAQRPLEGMLPLVLFLTDGLPTSGITSESAIRELVTNANPYNRRVYTFGVGYDLNAPLLEGIAYGSKAQPVFVKPDDDVEAAVTQVFKNLQGPVLTDGNMVILTTDGKPAHGRVQDILPSQLPDLYKADRLVVLGRYLGAEPLTFRITGNRLGHQEVFTYTFGFGDADRKNGFIPRLWASRKIAELIGLIRQLGADQSLRPDDPRLAEVAQAIVDLSIRFGIITEYTAFLAREGTSLGDLWQLVGSTAGELYNRGVADRTGSGAVNQGLNMAMQRSQDVLNRDSSYLNSQMERERIVNTQQANDLTFYYKNGRWIDSRLADIADQVDPHLVVEYGSGRFMQIAEALAAENRQGALAFAQDILILLDGQIILIDIPAEMEEQYKPIDPATTTTPPPVRTGR